jgi:hypothetical protein
MPENPSLAAKANPAPKSEFSALNGGPQLVGLGARATGGNPPVHEWGSQGGPTAVSSPSPSGGSPPNSGAAHEFSALNGGPQAIATITPESGSGKGD